MTRNFEEEYKRYADSSVPDLWDRIEKAIDEKEVKKEDNKHFNKNKVIVFVSRHAGLAIAAACVLLSIGALRLIGRVGVSKSEAAASAEATDEAMPDMDYIAGGYDDAPAAAAEAASEAPMAEAEEADDVNKAADMNMFSVICTLDDVSGLEKDHKITVSIKDPLGSNITEGSSIVAVIGDELYDELSPLLKDGVGKEYEIVIEKDENADEYRLYYAQIKK